MENHTEDDLKSHLLATDDSFRSLCEQHAEYSRLIDAIEANGHVTEG